MLIDIVLCPDPACRAPAEVVDRWTFDSTDGPIEHVRTRCLRGHVFTPMLRDVMHSVFDHASQELETAGSRN